MSLKMLTTRDHFGELDACWRKIHEIDLTYKGCKDMSWNQRLSIMESII